MNLKKLMVDGFRSLVDFTLIFDDKLTVIVGENDAGKTSFIDCVKVVTQGRAVTIDDFTDNRKKLNISLETDDFCFSSEYEVGENEQIASVSMLYPTTDFICKVLEKLKDPVFDTSDEKNRIFIKETATKLSIAVRVNSNIDNLRGCSRLG